MKYIFFTAMLLAMGCQTIKDRTMDIQGHRGARGNLPENSIPAMLFALEAGVNTLELDVVISADSQVVVSHEPWMSSTICRYPDGSSIAADEAMSLNLFQLTYEEIKAFDCGSKGHDQFPDQNAIAVYKPLLSELLAASEQFITSQGLNPVNYNIEIKSHPDGDNLYHPTIETFVDLVVDAIERHVPRSRYNIQSFDVRVLKHMHNTLPDITLSYLIGEMGEQSLDDLISDLGFEPDIVSPYYPLIDEAFMTQAKSINAQVIPWTINDVQTMQELAGMGVDGIITDYPMMAIEIFGSHQEVN